MAERVDFERLSQHDLHILRSRREHTVLHQWQVEYICMMIEDLRATNEALTEQLGKELDVEVQPTYE